MSTLVSYNSGKIGLVKLQPNPPKIEPEVVRSKFLTLSCVAPVPTFLAVPERDLATVIREAKKGIPVTITDKQIQTLTINNSCNLIFTGCNAERLEIIGEWTEVFIQGLKIHGQSPLHIEGKCTLEACKIESTKKSVRVDATRLFLSNCQLTVVGKKGFRLADKTAVSVRNCQIKIEDIMHGVRCFTLKGNCKVSMKYSYLKMHGDYVQTSLLVDAEENNNSEVKLTDVSVRCRSGCYLTCRYLMQIKINQSRCDDFVRVPLFARTDAPLLQSAIDDPMYTKRTFYLEDSVEMSQRINASAKKITFAAQTGITDDLDIDGSIFIRSFSASSFQRKENDFIAKLLMKTLSIPLVAYDCTFILSELILDGNLNFNSSKVYIRECQVNGQLTVRESSVKCESVRFSPESIINLSFCKLRTKHCEFKSTLLLEGCDTHHIEATFE